MLNEIYIVRHGHPLQGTNIPYDRAPGPGLSELGRGEARTAALYLRNCGIARLYSSPLDRALETAAIIAEETELAAETDPDIAEMRYDEAYDLVKTRMGAFRSRIETSDHERIAFVSHGSPIKAMLQHLSGEKIDLTAYNFPGGNPVPTAGIWRALRTESGWSLELIFEPARVQAS